MNLVSNRKWFYLFSLALIIPGVLALLFWGLRLGIDFAGGAVATLGWEKSDKSTADLKKLAEEVKLPNLSVQATGNNELLIRYAAKSGDEAKSRLTEVEDKLKPATTGLAEKSFAVVGPSVSKSLTEKAIRAVIVASVFIILYIAWAFRAVRAPASAWAFGVMAVIALLHDLLVTAGIFSILGHFLLWIEVDSLFITAMLTVLGFSVHDTIVVFDRIRENLRLNAKKPFVEVVNDSLVQTLGRSFNTSLTVLLTLLALFMLGSTATRGFVLALLIGVTAGTYSSIFVASMLLVTWQTIKSRRKSRTTVPTIQPVGQNV